MPFYNSSSSSIPLAPVPRLPPTPAPSTATQSPTAQPDRAGATPVSAATVQADWSKKLRQLDETRGVKFAKQVILTAAKVYGSYAATIAAGIAANDATMAVGKNPQDGLDTPSGVITGAIPMQMPNNPMPTVQDRHEAVLQTYGACIAPDACSKPSVKFTHGIQLNEPHLAGTSTPGGPGSGASGLTTSHINLAQNAALEYLHCYSVPFAEHLQQIAQFTPEQRAQIKQGMTEFFTQKMGVRSATAGAESLHHSADVKLVKKILKDVGLTVLQDAYFKNQPGALAAVATSALAHLVQDSQIRTV